MEDDIIKKLLVVKANLIAQGFAEEFEEGMRLTQRGYEVAYNKWMALEGEERILIALFLKAVIRQ